MQLACSKFTFPEARQRIVHIVLESKYAYNSLWTVDTPGELYET